MPTTKPRKKSRAAGKQNSIHKAIAILDATAATTGTANGKTTDPDKKLDDWLKKQEARLKELVATAKRLKVDFVENARAQGKILLEVQERLSKTSIKFKDWVVKNTDIGHSTALLWIDVAKNYDLVKKRFVDSNGLESTVRNIRDAIRDARQEHGGGKPGSGRKKATDEEDKAEENITAENNAAASADETATDAGEEATPTAKWEQTAGKAETEAAATTSGKSEAASRYYDVTVMVYNQQDQAAFQQALSQWSPSCKTVGNTLSVKVHAQMKGIAAVLQKLGKVLEESQPARVSMSVEL